MARSVLILAEVRKVVREILVFFLIFFLALVYYKDIKLIIIPCSAVEFCSLPK